MGNNGKKQLKMISQKQVVTIGIIVAISLAIAYLNLAQYIAMFIWMVYTWLMSNIFASIASPLLASGLILLQKAIVLLIPGLILGFILKLFKIKDAFKLGFIVSLIAACIAPILAIFMHGSVIIQFFSLFISQIIAAVVGVLCAPRITKTVYVGMIIVGLVLFNLLALSYVTNFIGRPLAQAKRANELTQATSTLKFAPYYPAYIPEGLEAKQAKLEGYHNGTYQHKRVSYQIGTVEFMVSEKLKNQDPVFNKTDNCDIGQIWFTMRTKDQISQAEVDKSRDNLKICQVLGKTDTGYEVYIHAGKSQFEFYYMEIDGTIIVAERDKLLSPRYADDFQNEMMKVYNGMNKLDSTKLEAGY